MRGRGWNPRSLSSDDAWNLTAYLMRERGELPPGLALDLTSASAVRLNPDRAFSQPAGAVANPLPLAVTVAIAPGRAALKPCWPA